MRDDVYVRRSEPWKGSGCDDTVQYYPSIRLEKVRKAGADSDHIDKQCANPLVSTLHGDSRRVYQSQATQNKQKQMCSNVKATRI
jgi:hypothetical protein